MLSDYFILLSITLIIVGLLSRGQDFNNNLTLVPQPQQSKPFWGWFGSQSQTTDRPINRKQLEVFSLYPTKTGFTQTTEMLNKDGVLDISIQVVEKSFDYMFDAVSLGHVKCILSALNYGSHSKLSFGVDLYSNYPFGLDDYWKIMWIFGNRKGQGLERLNNYLRPHNVYALPILVLPSQVTGWTNLTLSDSAETWKSVKMRTFGFATEIYKRLGAETYPLSLEEIPEAYKSGKINFYEFATLTIDKAMGLDQLGAKNYYISGHMEPSSIIYLIFNLDFWQSLSSTEQSLLRERSRVNIMDYLYQSDYDEKQALTQLIQSGVKVLQVPPRALMSVYNEWQKYVAEQRKKDSFFDQTITDLQEFTHNEEYWENVTGSWRDLLKWQGSQVPQSKPRIDQRHIQKN